MPRWEHAHAFEALAAVCGTDSRLPSLGDWSEALRVETIPGRCLIRVRIPLKFQVLFPGSNPQKKGACGTGIPLGVVHRGPQGRFGAPLARCRSEPFTGRGLPQLPPVRLSMHPARRRRLRSSALSHDSRSLTPRCSSTRGASRAPALSVPALWAAILWAAAREDGSRRCLRRRSGRPRW